VDDKAIRSTMKDKYDVVVAGSREEKLKGQIIRIGSMGIVSKNEVLRTVDALGRALLEQGWNAKLEDALSMVEKVLS
jgi:aspartate aminotransferase-like enzyme